MHESECGRRPVVVYRLESGSEGEETNVSADWDTDISTNLEEFEQLCDEFEDGSDLKGFA